MRIRVACVALFALWVASPSSAQTAAPADEALARYRSLTSVAPKRCTTDPSPDVITVCANKLRESQRVPYIEETRVGDRPKRVLGEPPGQDPGPSCGPRGAGCYSGPGLKGAIQGLIDRIRD